MEYQIELLDRPAQPTLSVRVHTPVQRLPQVIGQSYGAIMQHASQMGHQPSGAPFVAYYNMDMENLDVEIGFPFPQPVEGKGDVLAGEIPGGKAATCLHIGPYDQVGAAYDALQTWMEEKGHVPTGVAYEFYLNDPQTTPPAELQTRVLFPLI